MVRARSIQILSIDEGNVSINTEAVDSILDEVGNRKFVLISINGPSRTGKSFMLTKFLAFLHAQERGEERTGNWMEPQDRGTFGWRGGNDRHTVGIHIWSKPIIREVNGSEIAILLMDTQGNFDSNSTIDQNAKIFAISSLFSSLLIFNVMRNIQEDILQFFQLFSGYAKMINQDQSTQSTRRGTQSTQKLIFLLRDTEFSDFKFGFYDDQHIPVGQTTNFKKVKLEVQATQPEEVKSVRRDIASSFPDIGVFLLPHPGRELARNSSEGQLDPEFKTHLKQFVKFIFTPANLKVKQFGGIPLTGLEFKRYVRSWADVFTGNSIPRVESVFESAAKMQNSIALKKGIDEYEKRMEKMLTKNPDGVSRKEFPTFHDEAYGKAVDEFKKQRCFGGADYEKKFLEKLENKLESKKEEYFERNSVQRKQGKERLSKEAEIQRLKEEKREMRRKEVERVRKEKEAAERRAREMEEELEKVKAKQQEQQKKLEEQERQLEEQRRQQEQDREPPRRPWDERLPWPFTLPGLEPYLRTTVQRLPDLGRGGGGGRSFPF